MSSFFFASFSLYLSNSFQDSHLLPVSLSGYSNSSRAQIFCVLSLRFVWKTSELLHSGLGFSLIWSASCSLPCSYLGILLPQSPDVRSLTWSTSRIPHLLPWNPSCFSSWKLFPRVCVFLFSTFSPSCWWRPFLNV